MRIFKYYLIRFFIDNDHKIKILKSVFANFSEIQKKLNALLNLKKIYKKYYYNNKNLIINLIIY